MEAQKEATVCNFRFEVCLRHEEFVPERKLILEMEKEAFVSEDLEKVHSSFLSRNEDSVSERVTSPIQETESIDSH